MSTEIELTHQKTEIIKYLRQATHEVHERLHKHPLTKALMSHTLTSNQYILVLQAFERFHQMIEKEFEGVPQFYTPTKGSEFLKQDLETLHQNNNHLPECPALNLTQNTASFFGMMYVIEGSNLGGQIIAKNISKTLDYTQDRGAVFFNGRGSNTAKHWKSFLLRLNQQVMNVGLCTNAAVKTFSTLEEWLWFVVNYQANFD